MSTIFADKFKNTSGGNPVQINQLRGIDTAGSITVQGEGTATTNLQQGLAKAWSFHDQADGSGELLDSLNVSSADDDGTGLVGINFTNAMGNANYSVALANEDGSGTNDSVGIHRDTGSQTRGTGEFNYIMMHATSPNDGIGSLQVLGDLA
tara:strand:+ start:66 stop:518 length:453 start_codon:yes stop_codon:yes gene_type:complete